MEENAVSCLDPKSVDTIPPGVLAYIGDAVYELYVRENLLKRGLIGERFDVDLDELHKEAVLRVCATAQAHAIGDLESFLMPDEADVARRARNIKAGRGPRSMPVLDYRHSTGFEAVIGYLYLLDRGARLEELMSKALSLTEARLAESGNNSKDK
jgi:ribonuclease-3 family protein